MATILLKDLLSEITNTSFDYGYHYTSRENYEKIKTEGLRINQPKHHAIGITEWAIENAYGMSPIFMGVKPQKQYGPRTPLGGQPINWVLLKVNVSGLNIAADIGTLIDHGAYVEENGFWFKKKPDWLGADEYSYEDLQGSETFDLNNVIKKTETFVVLEDIDANRIQKIGEHNKFSLGKIMNYLTKK